VVLLAEGFEDLEFWVTVMRLREEGAEVETVSANALDAVVVPGGWAPDKLRRYDAVKDLVAKAYPQARSSASSAKPVWSGISAGIVDGKRATGSLGSKTTW
jgi:protease I